MSLSSKAPDPYMQKRYFFIGDSHPMYILKDAEARGSENNLYLRTELDSAISMHVGPTMWSFDTRADHAISMSGEDISKFKYTVFIFGTNDVIRRMGEGASLTVCVDKYLNKIKELSWRLSLPHPIVLSPTPCGNLHTDSNWSEHSIQYNSFEDIKSRFKEVDTLLQQGCQARSLDFLSMYDLLALDGSLDPQYSLDGIHFNSSGRTLYLSRLDAYLQPQ